MIALELFTFPNNIRHGGGGGSRHHIVLHLYPPFRKGGGTMHIGVVEYGKCYCHMMSQGGLVANMAHPCLSIVTLT